VRAARLAARFDSDARGLSSRAGSSTPPNRCRALAEASRRAIALLSRRALRASSWMVGNCVARRNHKFFVVSCFFASFAFLCTPVSLCAAAFAAADAWGDTPPLAEEEKSPAWLLWVLGGLTAVPALPAAWFGLSQLVMLCADITNKERYGRRKRPMQWHGVCHAVSTCYVTFSTSFARRRH